MQGEDLASTQRPATQDERARRQEGGWGVGERGKTPGLEETVWRRIGGQSANAEAPSLHPPGQTKSRIS